MPRKFIAAVILISLALELVEALEHLTEANFEKVVTAEEYSVIIFDNPGDKEYMKVENHIMRLSKSITNSVNFYLVDAEVEEELADKFDVSAYPSIEILFFGIPIKSKPATLDELEEWINGIVHSEPVSAREKDIFKKDEFCLFFNAKRNSHLEHLMRLITKKNLDIPVYKSNLGIVQRIERFHGLKIPESDNFVLAVRSKDNFTSIYDNIDSLYNLEDWIDLSQNPVAVKIDSSFIQSLRTDKPSMVLFLDPSKGYQSLMESFTRAAERIREYSYTFVGDIRDKDTQKIIGENGITVFPSIIYFELTGDTYKRYTCRKEPLVNPSERFIEVCFKDYQKGYLPRHLRSEAPLEKGLKYSSPNVEVLIEITIENSIL